MEAAHAARARTARSAPPAHKRRHPRSSPLGPSSCARALAARQASARRGAPGAHEEGQAGISAGGDVLRAGGVERAVRARAAGAASISLRRNGPALPLPANHAPLDHRLTAVADHPRSATFGSSLSPRWRLRRRMPCGPDPAWLQVEVRRWQVGGLTGQPTRAAPGLRGARLRGTRAGRATRLRLQI
jgi:hypothetical protein